MKEGENIKCPECESEKWRFEDATRAPLQPKTFLVDGYTKFDKIPGKSFCICVKCGYIYPELLDSPPPSVTLKFTTTIRPKK